MAKRATERLIASRYALERLLGRGGMGVVWRARDQLLGRDVAIKEVQLPPALTAEDQGGIRARVLREARAAARLNHPNVVTLYDVVQEQDQGRIFIVMELVDAPTLAAVVRERGPLPQAEVAAVGLQVLDALRAAHRVGIVHRDVKPGNVMVPSGEGRVKLADFGIASLAGDPQLTATGLVLGSPAYMAPEQASGQLSGPTTDLWALGATMYYALEGEPPFERDGAVPTLTAVVNDPPRPMRRGGELEPLVLGMLAKSPTERPSGGQLRHQLERLAGPGPGAPVSTAVVPGPIPAPPGDQHDTAPLPVVPPPAVEEPEAPAAEEQAGPAEPAPPEPATARVPPEEPEAAPSEAATAGQPEPVPSEAATATAPPEEPGLEPPAPSGGPEDAEPAKREEPATQPAAASPQPAAPPAVPGPARRPAQAAPSGQGPVLPVPAPVEPRRRAPASLLLALLGLALAGGLLVFFIATSLRGDGGGETPAGKERPAASSPETTEPETTEPDGDQTTAPQPGGGAVPAGFEVLQNPKGHYAVAYPEDWDAEAHDSEFNTATFEDDETERSFEVRSQSPPADLLAASRNWEQTRRDLDGYQLIRQHEGTYQGKRAVITEYTYEDKGERRHERHVNVAFGDWGYSVVMTARDADWAAADRDVWRTVEDNLRTI